MREEITHLAGRRVCEGMGAWTHIDPAPALTRRQGGHNLDTAVAQVHAQLLVEGVYLASVSAMYRMLRAHGEVRARRDQRHHPPRSTPVLSVQAPNEPWSWNITRLPELARGVGFFPYALLDVFSRFVVGWSVAQRQSAERPAR